MDIATASVSKKCHRSRNDVPDYVEDVYRALSAREHILIPCTKHLSLTDDYLRTLLVSWMLEGAVCYRFCNETKFLMVDIVDHFLAKSDVREPFLLLAAGAASMCISSKYIQRQRISLRSLVDLSDRAFSKQDVVTMERVIFERLGFCVSFPSPYSFLVRYKPHTTPQMFILASVFLQQTLKSQSLRCLYLPSQLAAASVFIARDYYLDRSWAWPSPLETMSSYNARHVAKVAQSIMTAPTFAVPPKKVST